MMYFILYIFKAFMAITSADIVTLSQARARLSELADEVKAGAEKIITKNGESYVALIDAKKLDHYHRLEQESVNLELIRDAKKALDEIRAGRTVPAGDAIVKVWEHVKAKRAKRDATGNE
jgi:prevent-host-death family protein